MRLVRIGYWLGDRAPGWPDPGRWVDPAWAEEEREELAGYLDRGMVARAYMGKSICRLCGELVGALELSDGTYVWPEGLSHYVRVHGVRLPAEIVMHARRLTECLEDAEIDDSWWRSLG